METDELKSLLSSTCNDLLRIATAYIIPIFQLTAFIINILNTSILISWANPLHRYLSVYSMAETFLSVLYTTFTRTLCSRDPETILTYRFQFFKLCAKFYLIGVIRLISSLVNIQIAIDRYFITFRGFNSNKKIKGRVLVFVLVSLIFFLPNLIFNKIYKVEKTDNNTYNIVSNDANATLTSNSTHFYIVSLTENALNNKNIQIALVILEYSITFINALIMIVMNVLIYKSFKKSQKLIGFIIRERKSKKTQTNSNGAIEERFNNNNNNESNRLTTMVVWISCVFMLDQILAAFTITFSFFFGRRSFIHLTSIAIFFFFRSIFSLSNAVFYYKFYHKYRLIIKRCLFLISFLIILTIVIFFMIVF